MLEEDNYWLTEAYFLICLSVYLRMKSCPTRIPSFYPDSFSVRFVFTFTSPLFVWFYNKLLPNILHIVFIMSLKLKKLLLPTDLCFRNIFPNVFNDFQFCLKLIFSLIVVISIKKAQALMRHWAVERLWDVEETEGWQIKYPHVLYRRNWSHR